MRTILCLVLCGLVWPAVRSQLLYNCNNFGSERCGTNGGVCDPLTGACDCQGVADAGGYQCTFADPVADQVCDLTCAVDGLYSCPAGVCNCNEGFFGELCDQRRSTLDCLETSAVLTVTPYAAASSVYLMNDLTGFPDCVLTETDGTWSFDNYAYEQPADSNCPSITGVEVDTDEDGVIDRTEFVFNVYVEYQEGMRMRTDNILTYTCFRAPDGEAVALDIIQSTVGDNVDDIPVNRLQDALALGITWELLLVPETGDPIPPPTDTPLTIGDNLLARITLVVGSITEVSLMSMTSYNFEPNQDNLANPPANSRIYSMIDNWCVTTAASGVSVSLTKTGGPNADNTEQLITIDYEFTAFSFLTAGDGSTLGAVYMVAEVCQGACVREVDCAPDTHIVGVAAFDDTLIPIEDPNAGDAGDGTGDAGDNTGDAGAGDAGANTGGARRKRRQAENNLATMDLSFIVLDPNNVFSPARNSDSDGEKDDSCLTSLTFILPLAVLLVILLVSLATSFYFFTRVSRSRDSHAQGEMNMSYKA